MASSILKRGFWFDIVRLCCLIAVAVSAAMLMDYTSPDTAPAFCAEGSGCSAVRLSGYGYWWGFLPVPLVGLVGFACLLALSLVNRLERFALYGTAIGAAAGVTFLWIQASQIGTYCSLCVVVDITSIVAFIAALLHVKATGEDRHLSGESHLRDGAWGLLALIVGVAPPIWTEIGAAPSASPTLAELQEPGKINVIEFADFECPHCRKIHPIIDELVHEYGDRVNFQRFMRPLRNHPYAHGAALAYLCAKDQGEGEPMADELFKATVLDNAALQRIATGIGLDMPLFDACVKSPETAAIVEKHGELFRKLGLKGIPTTFVNDEEIVGSSPASVFREAFVRAERGDGTGGMPAWLYSCIIVAALIIVAWFGRVRD